MTAQPLRGKPGRSVRRHMAVGAGWTVAARWSVRSIGTVSTILLARLLTPADFGLVAMAMLTVAFLGVFAEAGQDLAIIRHPDPTPEHFDTAWTMSVCVGAAVALALFAVAPLTAWYFHDPRVAPLTRFLALVPFFEGFTNVGVVAGFRRDLAFNKDFNFLVMRKLAVFVVGVPLAFLLRDYRALVAGIVAGRLITVLASYLMHPYRPRLRLTKLRELWSFSAWTQLGAVAQYFGEQTDQLFVGGLGGAAAMGRYLVARDLATSPTDEIVIPAARSLFPVYATLVHDPARLAQSYLDVLSFIAVIALSTGIGMAIVAPDMVAVVLGSKWRAAAALVPWLAIGGGALGVARSVNNILNVTGNARLGAVRDWSYLALLAPPTVLCGLRWGSEGVAAARMAVTLIFVPIMFYSLTRVVPVSCGQIIARLWRPALAALAMAAGVAFSGTRGIPWVAARLLCNVGLGAGIFAAVLLALWLLAGRPDGAERLLVAQASVAASRLLAVAARLLGRRRVGSGARELAQPDPGSN